jgi:hypothetical protein
VKAPASKPDTEGGRQRGKLLLARRRVGEEREETKVNVGEEREETNVSRLSLRVR